jgi:O-antigen/teichoic acid export membrane protein
MIISELLQNLRPHFDKKLFGEMLRFSLPTIPSSFSSMMLQVADRPIMMMLAGGAAVGMYQANYRLGIPMMLAVLVFEYAWKPFYLSHRNDADIGSLLSRALVYFSAVCGAIFLAGSLLIEFIVQIPFPGGKLINPAYWSGLGIVPIVLAGYYFNGVFTHLSAAFHITKRTGYLPMATAAAAAANIALNFILIPVFGIAGGAWATFGAYLLSAITAKYYAKKIYPVRYDWKRVVLIATITIILYIAGLWTHNLWLRLGVIAVYVPLLIVFGILSRQTFAAFATKFLRRKK